MKDRDDAQWLETWLAHCRECWLRMQMLKRAKMEDEG